MYRVPMRLVLLVLASVASVVVLASCNEGPGDSAPSEVPASAPMDSSASS